MDPARPLGLSILLLLLTEAALGNAAQEPTGNNAEICLLPLDYGPCRALLARYYYDRYTQSCRQFLYGGCEGNANNFYTWEACDEACWRIEIPSFCYSPKDEGLCFANVTRYYFNPRYRTCDAFTYTGCGGNDNNFVSREDCKRACAKALRKKKKMPKLRFASRIRKIRKKQF
ncbi:tissue factor pathway inhibitor 2 isoform X3 [Pongo pygmaeus]|uniref:tissue factor pathway inhibitor 2 isoform X3 n=1 Tax=Pongo pygmaeus TaxID=9600 RepID=UPI0023E34F4A|nr:tissue factor pathway inhibitor 2 isoform X3 [Pongo pygmaeus]